MILLDTSSLIDHFKKTDLQVAHALENGQSVIHPFVLGELTMSRDTRLEKPLVQLTTLPKATIAGEEEVHTLVKRFHLKGTGIGWIDAHLLASAKMSGAKLLTNDLALRQAAAKVLA